MESAPPTSLLAVDYGSEDDDDDEQEKQSVMDALEPSSILDDALDTAEKGPDTAATDSGFGNVEFKRGEDSEEPHSAISESKMDVDEEDGGEKPDVPKTHDTEDKSIEEQEKPPGLKDSSDDPTLSQADSLGSNGEAGVSATSGAKPAAKANIYAPLREYLAYSDADKLFLDLNDLDRVVMNASADELSADPAFPPTDLSEIFPDLPPLGMLEVAPSPPANAPEGRTKKSEKRADRDDPNKRVEDTMYTKLFPIGKFMYTKPTLIGPLQPAKRWKNGHWLNADDCPASDPDTPPVKMQDSLSGKQLF
jgi:chromatin modification-related protein VID21